MLLASAQESWPFELDELLPSGAALVGGILVLGLVRLAMSRMRSSPTKNFRIQVTMLALTLATLLAASMLLPLDEPTKGQLMGLIGIVLSAAIALASTTFLGNALAGIQLRVVGAFQSGDFLRVGDHFGRVTERGLFHTEIQTEDRDLTTLPNLFLVSNPYKVVRASGTIIATTVSLGYDAPRAQVQECLISAAERAELDEPFVQVENLGDNSVTYRIAGLLTDVKQILTVRSLLRKRVMDELHGAGIEIVSPVYMTTRAIQPSTTVLPAHAMAVEEPETPAPEAMIFDKAEDAELLLKSQQRLEKLGQEIADSERRVKAADDETRPGAQRELDSLRRERESLAEDIETIEKRIRPESEDDH